MKKGINEITKVILGLLLLIVLLGAIVYFLDPSHSDRAIQLKNEPNFPSYVYNSDKSLLAYRIAITIPDVLKAIPCTCGCRMIGHQSDKDCFINDQGYSPHAANCDICEDIAIDAFKLYKQGYSVISIKNIIHKKYETTDR